MCLVKGRGLGRGVGVRVRGRGRTCVGPPPVTIAAASKYVSDAALAEKLPRPLIDTCTEMIVPGGRYGVWHMIRLPLMKDAGTTFSSKLSGSVLLSCERSLKALMRR